MRGWECLPLTPGAICKEGNLRYNSQRFSEVKLAIKRAEAAAPLGHHAGCLLSKQVNLILLYCVLKQTLQSVFEWEKRAKKQDTKQENKKSKSKSMLAAE